MTGREGTDGHYVGSAWVLCCLLSASYLRDVEAVRDGGNGVYIKLPVRTTMAQ